MWASGSSEQVIADIPRRCHNDGPAAAPRATPDSGRRSSPRPGSTHAILASGRCLSLGPLNLSARPKVPAVQGICPQTCATTSTGNGASRFSGRRPTSHERRSGLPWDGSYHDGPAPWDLGQPEPAVVRVASEGAFAGAVLDAGCGTGENSLHVASLGLSVLGVDVAATALAIARAPERRPTTVGSRLSSLRLTRSSGSVWSAGLRRCSTADCSTPSSAMSDQDSGESGVGDRARWNPVCVVPQRRNGEPAHPAARP